MTSRNGTPARRTMPCGNRAGAPNKLYRTLSTGQVAALLGCAPRTVQVWFDRGEFPGAWRLPPGTDTPPGGGGRRVPRAAVLDFCRRHGVPVPVELAALAVPALLLAGLDAADLARLLAAGLPPGVAVEVAATPFAAGMACAPGRRYAAAVVDAGGLGRATAEELLSALGDAPAAVLLPEDAQQQSVWKRPFDWAALAAAVRGWCGRDTQ